MGLEGRCQQERASWQVQPLLCKGFCVSNLYPDA